MTQKLKLKKNSRKSLFKIHCCSNSGARKIQDLQKHSSKKIHVTLQPDYSKHKPFQFIPRSNVIEGFQNLSPGIGDKVLSD